MWMIWNDYSFIANYVYLVTCGKQGGKVNSTAITFINAHVFIIRGRYLTELQKNNDSKPVIGPLT